MKKYRIKNSLDETIGPFLLSEIPELIERKKIKENDLYQIFPVGEWERIEKFQEVMDLFRPVERPKITEDKRSADIEKIELKDEDKYSEFEYSINKPEIEVNNSNKAKVDEEESIDATVLINKKNIQEEIEKTVFVNKNDIFPDGEKGNEAQKEAPAEGKKIEDPVDDFDPNQETVVMKLDVVISKEKNQEIYEVNRELKRIKSENLKENEDRKNDQKKQTEEKKDVAPVGGRKNILIIVIVLICVFIFIPENKKEKVEIESVVFAFPIVNKYQDLKRAESYFEEGVKYYKKNTYRDKIKAVEKFSKSLENSFKKNKSLPYLILTYSELLKEVKSNQSNNFEAKMKETKDNERTNKLFIGKVISQLISVAGSKIYSDVNVALGASNYYSEFGKFKTSLNILNSYLRLNKPTPKIYAKILQLNLILGDYITATARFKKLVKVEIKDIEVLIALVDYYLVNEKDSDAIEILEREKTKFNDNYYFLVKYCELLFRDGNFRPLSKIVDFILKKKGGGSPYVYAKGLKYKGHLEIRKGNLDIVSKYFNESLKYADSEELRILLANLEISGSELSQRIILKSKVERLMKKSREAILKYDWSKAFEYSIEATDLDPENIDATLLLVEIKNKRGFYNSAITSLEKLRDEYPLNKDINYHLVMANINSFKRREAKRLLAILSTLPNFKGSYESRLLFGHYYKLIGNYKFSYDNFREAIKKNPINDEIYYELAKLSFSRNQFKRTKFYLTEAIKLDPFNIDYKILYAKVLYDSEDVVTAIGYLRGELERNKNSSKIIGQMAIFYYRNQDTRQYQIYKKRLEKINIKDESLYRYLLETALIEKDDDSVIRNGEKLLIINPGDLKSKIKIAKVYMKLNDKKNALKHLIEIDEKMSAYPKVNFYKAEIYLSNSQFKEAEDAARKEVKISQSEYGYYILGKIFLKDKNLVEAKEMFQKALQVSPAFYECLISLGQLKYKQGYYRAARELFSRALNKRPDESEVHKKMGYTLRKMGQGGLAIEYFMTYLTLNPVAKDREIIREIIKLLK